MLVSPAHAEGPQEAYAELLREVVRSDGVDLSVLRARRTLLDAYIAALPAEAPAATEQERLAFWINAYNALALRELLDGRDPASAVLHWRVAGEETTLDAIRERIRQEPRVHLALHDGTPESPPLAAEPYRAGTLDVALTQQARAFLADEAKNRFDTARQQAELSPLFLRYRADFERVHAGEPEPLKLFLADIAPKEEIARSLRQGRWLLLFREPGERAADGDGVHPLWIALYLLVALSLLALALRRPRARPPLPGPHSHPPEDLEG